MVQLLLVAWRFPSKSRRGVFYYRAEPLPDPVGVVLRAPPVISVSKLSTDMENATRPKTRKATVTATQTPTAKRSERVGPLSRCLTGGSGMYKQPQTDCHCSSIAFAAGNSHWFYRPRRVEADGAEVG